MCASVKGQPEEALGYGRGFLLIAVAVPLNHS